jgi:pilus assembly protein CpaB
MIARRLILALFFALLISGAFTYWLSRKVSRPHAQGSAAHKYVTASMNLDAGEAIKKENLKLVDWPGNTPLPGAFTKTDDVIGRVMLFPVAAGEPVLERQLSAPGSGTGLANKVTEGMRAISLKSDEIVGVAGFLLPGTHVDVLVTYPSPASQEPVTATVLQNVVVLAAGQKIQPDPDGKAVTVDVVTLLVTPRDAERAVMAAAHGSVHFDLRNGADQEQLSRAPLQLSQLEGPKTESRAAASPAPHKFTTQPKSSYVVETIAGGKQTVDTF